MTTLAQYSAARAALAETSRVDQVMHVRDEVEHLKLYARQIKDRTLMSDALDLQLRCERRLGILLLAAKDAGQIAEGRRPRNCAEEEQFPRVVLADAGIDRKLSSKAQKAAKLSERAFEAMVKQARDRITGTIVAKTVNKAKRAGKQSDKQPAPVEILTVDPSQFQHEPAPDWHRQSLAAIGAVKLLLDDAPDLEASAWLRFLITSLLPAENHDTEAVDPDTGEIITIEAASLAGCAASISEEGAGADVSSSQSISTSTVPLVEQAPDATRRLASGADLSAAGISSEPAALVGVPHGANEEPGECGSKAGPQWAASREVQSFPDLLPFLDRRGRS